MKVFSIVFLCLTIGFCEAQTAALHAEGAVETNAGSVSASGSVSADAGSASGSLFSRLPGFLFSPVISRLESVRQSVNGAISSGRDNFGQMVTGAKQMATNGLSNGREMMNSVHSGIGSVIGTPGSDEGVPLGIGGMVRKAAVSGLNTVNQFGNNLLDLKDQALRTGAESVTSMGNMALDRVQGFADEKFSASTNGLKSAQSAMGTGINMAGDAFSNALSTAQSLAGNALSTGKQALGAAFNAGSRAAETAMNLGTRASDAARNAMNAGSQTIGSAMNAGAQAISTGSEVARSAMNSGMQNAGAAMGAGIHRTSSAMGAGMRTAMNAGSPRTFQRTSESGRISPGGMMISRSGAALSG